MSAIWKVIIGNVGAIYEGESEKRAREDYKDYSDISKGAIRSRVNGEPVTLLKDGVVVLEHNPFKVEGVLETVTHVDSLLENFEITAVGFDGGDDSTDDRVIWVRAERGYLMDLLKGEPYQDCDDLPFEGTFCIDFTLPQDAEALVAKLRHFDDNP